MVPLKIVLNVSRFKPALNLNRVLADLNRGSNSLNSISDQLIWISTVETSNFVLNPLLLDIILSNTCNKDTFDYRYRYNAISIELISDWTNVSCSQADFKHLNNYKFNHVNMNLYHIWSLFQLIWHNKILVLRIEKRENQALILISTILKLSA